MSSTATFSPIAELARICVSVAQSDTADVYSVEVLSRLAGLSRRAFHNRCEAAGIAGRDCLHFVQCLRALIAADSKDWDPGALIPVGDPRTLRKILMKARFDSAARPSIPTFVACQQFCTSVWFQESVLHTLEQWSPINPD